MSTLDQLLEEFHKQLDYFKLLHTYSDNCNETVILEEAIKQLDLSIKKMEKWGFQRDIEHLV